MVHGGLGPGPEFDLIRGLLAAASDGERPDWVEAGPGDDAAVLRVPEGERLVASTDMAVEEVHFRRAWLDWPTVGYRAAAAALSDVAAMAARPLGLLLSVALPPELGRSVLEDVGRGTRDCLREQGGALLGGDVARSPGPVVLDVAALGAAEAPVRRDGVRPGDELWVTGDLGGAATAAADWLNGLEPDPRARRAFERPRPRVAEARWLAEEAGVRAMIDVSDGLAGDARHLAAASGVALELELERVPLAEVLEAWDDRAAARRRAVGGGEDYELLVAAEAGRVGDAAGRFRRAFGLELTRVGRAREGRGVTWRDADGAEVSLEGAGWDHFRGDGGGDGDADRDGGRSAGRGGPAEGEGGGPGGEDAR